MRIKYAPDLARGKPSVTRHITCMHVCQLNICTGSKMSKKKQQRNGFFYFMLDMQQELRERGRNVPMHSMSAIAGPKWATMTDAQRQAYNQRAKMEKATARGTTNPSLMPPTGNSAPRYERMDSTGQKLSVSLCNHGLICSSANSQV